MVEAFKAPGVGETSQPVDKEKQEKTNACETDTFEYMKRESQIDESEYKTTDEEETHSLAIHYLNQYDFRLRVNQWIKGDSDDVIIALFAIEFDDFVLSAETIGAKFSTTLLEHSEQWFANDGSSGAIFTVLNSGRLLVAILNITETEVIWQISRELQEVFVNSVNSGLIYFEVHTCIGISLYPLIADNVDDLVNTSLGALALAKK